MPSWIFDIVHIVLDLFKGSKERKEAEYERQRNKRWVRVIVSLLILILITQIPFLVLLIIK